MICKIIILCVAALLPVQVFGQASAERAYNSIQKGKWDRAYGQLAKPKSKDSLSVATTYVLSLYFFAPANPDFQLDSAYRYVQIALTDYEKSTLRQRDRLRRFPLDSITLVELRQQIDSAAFLRARQINTEKSYLDFLSTFSTAAQQEQATLLRDEAAYLDALNENTYHAFDDFLTKYPNALRVQDARNKYEALLFLAKTSDKDLASYEQYLKEYPDTPYREEAEQNIFEIRTAPGTVESYKAFLDLYGESKFCKRAQNILFHLIPEDQLGDQILEYLRSDSLKSLVESDRGYIVPFFHSGAFGFMNQHGHEVITAESDEIYRKYLCGNVTEDVIVLPQKLVAQNGSLLWNRAVESIDDIGLGFILIQEELGEQSCLRVLHKTGYRTGDACIDAAKVLNGKFLALQKDERWSIWTLSGRMLMGYEWDEVGTFKDVITLKKDNRFLLATSHSIAQLADGKKLIVRDTVDEVKSWREDFVWVRSDGSEGVLDQSLNPLIKVEKHTLSPAYFGSTSTTMDGIKTFNDSGEESVIFHRLLIQEPWTAAKSEQGWFLFDPKTQVYQSPGYDSITFAGPFAVGLRKDTVRIYFSPSRYLDLKQPVRTEFIPGKDSSSFLLLEQGEKKSIYALSGKKIFTVNYDRIQYAGEGFFMVHKKEKKGLITSAAKPLLPIEFDAIGTVNKGVVSLLKSMKFGTYDCVRRKLIKPQYDKNLTLYTNEVLIVYKDGLYGFIGWDNKPIGKIEFNEVRYWTDSAAFVRKNSAWMIYEIKTNKILLDKIKDYKLIQDNNDEKIAILQQDQKYGVIHNAKGTIIPISFSDIINVGSRNEPLYFTEKHVEEASIFVVIYYDSKGNMLRKEVYEHDEYEKIYCSEN